MIKFVNVIGTAMENNFDAFVEKYRPICNKFASDPSETRFDYYTDEEYLFIMNQPHQNVWTLVEADDDKMYIMKGRHWVNRLAYFVCEVPYELTAEDYYSDEEIYLYD